MVHHLSSPSEGFGRSPEDVFFYTKGYGSARMTGSLEYDPSQFETLEGILINERPVRINQLGELVVAADVAPGQVSDTLTVDGQQSVGREAMTLPDNTSRKAELAPSHRKVQINVDVTDSEQIVPVLQSAKHRAPYRGRKPHAKK